MPFEIDEEVMRKSLSVDYAHPPMRTIPFLAFPAMVFKHPKEPYRKEIVDGKSVKIANEALTAVVQDQEELDAKLAEGWTQKMYVPPAPPSPAQDKLYA